MKLLYFKHSLIASFFLFLANHYFLSAQSTNQPNVLFIAIDDLNDWVGCMNAHPNTLTPNIDRLAASGTLFTNAHCQAPLCGPSRASLMSGLRPSTTGIYGQINDRFLRQAHPRLKDIVFLPQYFGQQGYKTMGVGKLFHQHAPEGVFQESGGREAGFGPKPPNRLHWDQEGTSTDWGAFPESDTEMPDYRSVEWAKTQLAQTHDQPFFLAVGFLRPHVPWHVPQKWFDEHPLSQIQPPPYKPDDTQDLPDISKRVAEVPMMPTTDWAIAQNQWPSIVQAYLACISFVDHYVGELLDALEASPYADNTLIVLFSDHGYHLGEKNRFAKHSLWEESTHVPLTISGPGLPKGKKCNKAVELLDLYPTLLDLCSLPPNPNNEGKSLRPLLENPKRNWPYAAVTTYGKNNHAVRTESFRYIHFEDGSEELYDHQSDPNEWDNVASNPFYQSEKQVLRNFIPDKNEHWSEYSSYDVIPFFKEQKLNDKD